MHPSANNQIAYLRTIYNNLDDSNRSHQLVSELAFTLMLANDLVADGWTQTRSPLSRHYAIDGGNWWIFNKNQRKLEIIIGDPYKGTDPDLIITDHCSFNRSANKIFNVGPELFGLHENSVANAYHNRTPKKLFNCFMSTANVTRQLCFYELIRKNLINDGAVSYLLNDQLDPVNTNESRVARYQEIKQDPLVDIFDHEHQLMLDQIPFKNFDSSLEQAIADSKISLVVETMSWSDQEMFLTEKTFRAVLMPRPFCVYVTGRQSGAVEYLRNLGFDVYDDIVDHSYDSISDPIQRLLAILEQVEKFRSFNYTEDNLLDFDSRAWKNLQIIKQLRANLPQKYCALLSELKAI
jgi:hypothetical protein